MLKLVKIARIVGVINNGFLCKKVKTWSNWEKSQELMVLSIMGFNAKK